MPTRTVTADTRLSVVAPMYNEEAIVERFVEEVRDALAGLDWPGRTEIVLVNDGSADGTGEALDRLAADHPGEIRIVHLARNFGHAPAVSAGLDQARGDAVILMDADLQDDPSAFAAFVAKWREGHDVVYATRTSRTESGPSRILFWIFYRLVDQLAQIHLPHDAGNFGLMDRRVVDLLRGLPERNRYLPGLRSWVGFSQVGVPVPRRGRYDDSTRVGFRGLWRLAMNAIFSFSYVPLAVFRVVGALAIGLSFLLILLAVLLRLFTDYAQPAWATQVVTTSFFGGINLLGLGVIGEYVARVHDEVKQRPPYVIDRVAGEES